MAKTGLQYREEIIVSFLGNLEEVTGKNGGARNFAAPLCRGMIDRSISVNAALREKKMPQLTTLFSISSSTTQGKDGGIKVFSVALTSGSGFTENTPVLHSLALTQFQTHFELGISRPMEIQRVINDGRLELFGAKQIRRMEVSLASLVKEAQGLHDTLQASKYAGHNGRPIIEHVYSINTHGLISVAPHFITAMGEGLLIRNDNDPTMRKLADQKSPASVGADIMFNSDYGPICRLGIC